MDTQISIPLPTAQFLSLADFLRDNGDRRDPVDVVAMAVEYWIDNASWKPELLKPIPSVGRGYQWKTLFLPDGTEIRMQYKGVYYYANVVGDKILYDGRSVSPATFANTVAQSSRNAWRDLWVRLAPDREWRLADECRSDSLARPSAEELLREISVR